MFEGKRFVYFIATIVAMGGILFGFDTGIIADGQWQITKAFGLTDWQWSSVVSSTVLGAFVGALLCGRAADKFGRRTSLYVIACLFIVGTLIAAFSFDWASLLVGRFILGLCIGAASFLSPLFISEIAPIDTRGRLVLFNNVAITGGEALSFLVGYILSDVSSSSWRIMFILGIIPPILLILGLFRMPKSPRWVAAKYDINQAKEILDKIRGGDQEQVQQEVSEIKQALSMEKETHLTAIFKKPIRKVVFIGVALGMLQQLCGINIIMYYGPFVFNEAGFSHSVSLFSTFIMGLTNTVFTLVALLTVDKLGRRPLMFCGALIAGLSLLTLAYAQTHMDTVSPWVSFGSIFVYMMAFAISLGCIFWLMISELYPLKQRGVAMSFATAIQWLTNFVVSLCFLPLYNYFGGGKTMLIFAGFCGVAVIFTIFFLPETRGVSLEKIEENLLQGKSCRKLGETN